VSNDLPCAKCRAIGKEPLCRVPHSAKLGTRQRKALGRCRTLGKEKHSAKGNGGTHRSSLPSAKNMTLGTDGLYQVPNLAHGKGFFGFLPPNFFV